MNLPDAVRAYFDAEKSTDADLLGRAFSESAIVHDEGETYQGMEPIRHWWLEAKRKYSHTAEPISATVDGKGVAVLANVRGNFPNSPAELRFRFVLEQDRITELEIG